MRIRSLEITGFKSFADRTVLAFDRGVSAIVGPNGCGKSNVVDAIRWVMGEQNPRRLRGRLMEDIIFAGTESKPAVGLAEVVLTLENSDGQAPAAYAGFSEIQVARRLYRSGESEYAINKVPCRLRDVLDFFMDTGIGVRGYTIVEQGQIAAIVSNRPEDRRIILEEAAGIGKYRQRRQETERKLAATEQNLLRVTDIIGELRRQISSLERQAGKARRYKELSARVRDLELVVTWEEHRKDAESLDQMGHEHEKLRAGVVAAETRVAHAEANLEAERRVHLDSEKELQGASETLYAIRSEIQSLENRVEYERREREGLLRLADERGGEINELETQVTAHSSSLAETVEALSCLEERLEGEGAQLEEREQVLAERSERLATLQGKREALQTQLVRDSSDSATLSGRADSLDERRRELELRLRQADETMDVRTTEDETLRRDEIALEARLREGLAEKDDLGRRLGELLRAHAVATETLDRQRTELSSVRESIQQATTRLESLREAERLYSTRLEETLQRMPAERRRHVRGVLADVLRVQEGFEPAVEAVLSGRLEAVLVPGPEEALDLLAWFRKESAGRATLLPISPADAGAAGFVPLGRPLLELVDPPAEFVPLVSRLLRDVYVVEDLAEPVRRYGTQEPPAVFVTPTGEILDRAGAFTGGTRQMPGVVSRASEIRRLDTQLESLETRGSELTRSTGEETRRAAQLAIDVENARSRQHTADLAVVNIEKDLERSRERMKEAELRIQDHRGLKEQLTGEIERAVIERDEVRSQLERVTRRCGEAETSREQVTRGLTDLGREVEQLEQKLVGFRIELAGLTARRSQLIEARERLEGALREGRGWLVRRREEVRTARDRGEHLGRSTEQASELLSQKIADEEEIRRKQEGLRQAYERSQIQVETVEAKVRAGSSEREATREKLGSSELALQEARLRGSQLVERILERYGIDLASYEPTAEQLAGDPEAREAELVKLRRSLDAIGDVHLGAIEEYEEVSERYRYLSEQKADLELSIERLRSAIARINRTSRARFRETFDQVNAEFQRTFPRLFDGGRAHLSLTESEEVLEAGIEISAQPPGKRLQNVNLLSGGEKALTALALLLSVFIVKPSPFFLLDEVDAALDDANVGRFNTVFQEIAESSQFLLITHNKRTIEIADTLFGVTMQEPGLSKLVTVDLVS